MSALYSDPYKDRVHVLYYLSSWQHCMCPGLSGKCGLHGGCIGSLCFRVVDNCIGCFVHLGKEYFILS